MDLIQKNSVSIEKVFSFIEPFLATKMLKLFFIIYGQNGIVLR